jgi:hypothetical protein
LDAEEAIRQGRYAERVPDLTGAGRLGLNNKGLAGAFGDQPGQSLHRRRNAATNIKHWRTKHWRTKHWRIRHWRIRHWRIHWPQSHPREQRSDYIGDVNKVAGLLPIPKDRDRQTGGDALTEDRNDAGVGGFRILSRPVYVEETEADGRYAMHVAGDPGM